MIHSVSANSNLKSVKFSKNRHKKYKIYIPIYAAKSISVQTVSNLIVIRNLCSEITQ